jgi:hypothetical protein
MTICRHSSGPTTETICYAGIEAEKKFSSVYNDKESYGDYCQIHGFASIFGMEEDTREAYLNWLILTARDMVSGPVHKKYFMGGFIFMEVCCVPTKKEILAHDTLRQKWPQFLDFRNVGLLHRGRAPDLAPEPQPAV